MDFLTKLLDKQTHFFPVLTTQEEAGSHKKDFDTLLDLGVLERISDPSHVWCETCQNEGVEVHSVSKGRAYTLCTQDEHARREYFNPSKIQRWQFNTSRFLLLFQEALGIQSPRTTENIEGLLWDFGSQKVNGMNYHLFFCRDINEIEKPKLSIITTPLHSVIFYTGTPQIALPKVLLVPLIDLVQKITSKKLSLDTELVEQFFPMGVYATSDGAIELDDNVVLQGNRLLFEPVRTGLFKKQSAELRPLATRIIGHLYGIRTYQQPSKTLDELATSLDSTKKSVSNEIGRIETMCTENNLQTILHKYAGEKWGINPQLKCCK